MDIENGASNNPTMTLAQLPVAEVFIRQGDNPPNYFLKTNGMVDANHKWVRLDNGSEGSDGPTTVVIPIGGKFTAV